MNTNKQTTFQLNTSFIHSVTYRVSVEFSLTMCILQQTAVGCTRASCRLLNFYDAFRDKQASAIVFHIYNLAERGAELKQSFMRERMSASMKKKKRFSDHFVLNIIHSLGDDGGSCRAQRKPLDTKFTPLIQAVNFLIMQNNSSTVIIAI